MRALGSENIDYRLRSAEFFAPSKVRWLGMPIAALSTLGRVLIVGSNLRKDHPLFALRIRHSARKGCAVSAINSTAELATPDAWAMPVAHALMAGSDGWVQALADVAAAIADEKGVSAPAAGQAHPAAKAIAASLLSGDRKAILLGNAAAHHANASSLLALASWIGAQTGATVGYLTEAANTVGAQWVKAVPGPGGLNAGDMLAGKLKAVILLNNEPEFDSAPGAKAPAALNAAQMVVTLSPFKANMGFSDVLLPIAPFTETPGTFVNAEGRIQSFHAVVRPLGDTRPAWKVLRVLANLLGLPGFEFESSQQVLSGFIGADALHVPAESLGNAADLPIRLDAAPAAAPVVAGIYQLDGLVRRSTPLQLTADARGAAAVGLDRNEVVA